VVAAVASQQCSYEPPPPAAEPRHAFTLGKADDGAMNADMRATAEAPKDAAGHRAAASSDPAGAHEK
jgi:hypothetical protein